MAQLRRLIPILVLAAAGLGAGALVATLVSGPGPAGSGGTARPLTAGTWLPDPPALPEFSLTEGNGSEFNRESLTAGWSLLFFGFANCPDVCPLTLAKLANVTEIMQAAGHQPPSVVFVSVDPERDTPADADRYARFFDPAFRAATGNEADLRRLTGPIGILHLTVPADEGAYTVDHSAAVLLIDPDARLAAVFSPPHDADAMAADLIAILYGS